MNDKNPSEIKNGKKKNIVGIIFTVIIAVATLVTLFQFADFGETMALIGRVKGVDLLIACLFLFAYILLYPLGINILSKKKKVSTGFTDNYLIGASEHFFNGITPYQTGAQPFQIYSFTQKGVTASDATAIVLVNFLGLLFASNIFVAISLIKAKDFFAPFLGNGTLWIPIIGIAMNFLVLIFIIAVATAKWVREFLKKAIRFFCKIKFIGRHLSKSIPAFDKYCDNAQVACKGAFRDLKTFIPLVIVKLLSLFCFYSIPYFILRALNVESSYSYGYSVLATAFTVNSVVWIPTPGTSGGIEFAFTTVFGLVKTDAAASSIIWRGLTYYILMIVSAIEYLIFQIKSKAEKNKEKKVKENTAKEKTFYSLPDKIDVLMAGDKGVLEGIRLTMLSAVMKTDRPINFHLFTAFSLKTKGITEEDAKETENVLKKVNPLTTVSYYDLTKDYDESFLDTPNEKPYYTVCSLLRLFAVKYVNSKRLIYLDADTMCNASIEEFFTYPIDDYEMAIVKDIVGRKWVRRDYFNSGVLFINVDKVKETNLFGKTIDRLKKHRYIMADQTALYLSSEKRLYLPYRFNEQRDIKCDTVIKHFNKQIRWLPFFHLRNVKQWNRKEVHEKLKVTEFDKVYEKYDELFKK